MMFTSMDTTHPSLLVRVKDRADSASWREFYDLYAPLLRRYARRRGLDRAEAEDLVRDCMKTLAEQAPGFDYRRTRGGFRRFLWTMINHRIIDLTRKRRPRSARSTELVNLAVASDDSRPVWDETWVREHFAYCLKRIETRMASETLAAFRMYVLEEKPVEAVCAALDMTPNQVYLAKSRVTRRLRREMRRLVGE